MNENLLSDHGCFVFFFSPCFSTFLAVGVLPVSFQTGMCIKPWCVPLAQSGQFLLTNSSGEEARCCSCRLEQVVCQESELFVNTFLGLTYFRAKILCALESVAF